MKNFLFTILMAASACGFADLSNALPITTSDLPTLAALPSQERSPTKLGFFYIRFTAAENDLIHSSSVLPGLGLGYRRLAGNGAADISVSGIGRAQRKNDKVYWTAPKTSYIHYLQPDAPKSVYVGGGLAWGGVETATNNFIGIIPSVTTGYEFVRKSTILGFAELTISQPAIAVYQKGKSPGPSIELSSGIGF